MYSALCSHQSPLITWLFYTTKFIIILLYTLVKNKSSEVDKFNEWVQSGKRVFFNEFKEIL